MIRLTETSSTATRVSTVISSTSGSPCSPSGESTVARKVETGGSIQFGPRLGLAGSNLAWADHRWHDDTRASRGWVCVLRGVPCSPYSTVGSGGGGAAKEAANPDWSSGSGGFSRLQQIRFDWHGGEGSFETEGRQRRRCKEVRPHHPETTLNKVLRQRWHLAAPGAARWRSLELRDTEGEVQGARPSLVSSVQR